MGWIILFLGVTVALWSVYLDYKAYKRIEKLRKQRRYMRHKRGDFVKFI